MKHWKRFSALALALALLAALVITPVSAASVSSFDDITDPTVALNADTLRFMGVVSGKGGNNFDPNGSLTRAEFCTMLIGIMGRSNEVAGQLNRTIFTDVTSRHWARGYVNLATSIAVGAEGKGGRLISGVGNGKFEPDRAITFGEASTILVRLLGYTDAQVGTVWPNDYVAKAGEIGLSKGVSAGAFHAITRAQAAQMFVNLLSCPTSAKTPYYNTLGTASEAILLSLNAQTGDGTPGAVLTTAQTEGILPVTSSSKLPATLLGKKGVQVVNGDGLLAAFIPDSSSSVTVVLSGSAEAGGLKGTNGINYAIAPSTTVYTAGSGEKTTYASIFDKLTSGVQVTLYTSNGRVTGLYHAGSSNASSEAVIVNGKASAAIFQPLTGGLSDYRILKDRQEITMNDIQANDVVTYDPVSNSLLVSDLRVTAVYEGASPSVRAPEKLQALGISGGLDVLPCALNSITQFKTNDTVTLLLTADGKVAGAVKPSSQVRSTAVGLLEGGKVTIPLPAGGTLVCSGANNSELEGQLVTVSSTSRGSLSVARLSSKNAPGAFNLQSMTLGQYTVAAGAMIYERVTGNSPLVAVNIGNLDMDSIPADKISTYSLNTSNMVDAIVLENVTGNAYTYGVLVEGSHTQSEGGLSATNRTVRAAYGSGESTECLTGESFTEGEFAGVAVASYDSRLGIHRAAPILRLTALSVSTSDFFVSGGVQYVSAGGRVYRVADGVVCYNAQLKEWFSGSGSEAVRLALASYGDLTVYVDPIGNMVRIISAK